MAGTLDSPAPPSYRQGIPGLGKAEGQMFLQTVAEEDATGAIAEVYRKEKAGAGFVPEAARCLSTRPDMPPLFDAFFDGIKANFSLSGREWCLITFVAAAHLRSTYCSQVYSKRLLALGESKETLLAMTRLTRFRSRPMKSSSDAYAPRRIAPLRYGVRPSTGRPTYAGKPRPRPSRSGTTCASSGWRWSAATIG